MTLPCHWYENPDHPGERFLIPGCYSRLDDPDQCTCTHPWDELPRLRRQVAELEAQLRDAQQRYSDLLSMVAAHPDGAAVLDNARKLAAARYAAAAGRDRKDPR